MLRKRSSVAQQKRFASGITSIAVAVLLLAGCAGQKTKSAGPVFFPPAPNPPRVQYLMGVSGSRDIVPDTSKLSLFLVDAAEEKKDITIGKPFGIAVHGTTVYLGDSTGKVFVIDLVQKQINFLKGDFGSGKLKKPIGLAVDREGNLYVADTQRKEIVIFDKDGNFQSAVGKELDIKPSDVAVDDEFIYILDVTGNAVKVLDRKKFELVREIGKEGENEDRLTLPIALDQDHAGFLRITNALSGKVLKYDRDGHLLQSFGELGDGFGQFGRPRGISTDREGITYVVDASHQNVQMFNEKGRLLMFFGSPGLPEGSLNMPADVAVGYDGLEYFQKLADPSFVLEKVIYVTSQFGKRKLSVYGLGHKK